MRQFEECSSQYDPPATIEEEGFALHYDGRANDATRDGAGQLRFCLRVATGEIHLRAKTYNDGTRDGTPGLTPQLARSSCVRCNPLELAHRISRERRERPQVRYLITRSFSEYSRRPGIKYPHVNPPHSQLTAAIQPPSSPSEDAISARPSAELGYKTWKSAPAQ